MVRRERWDIIGAILGALSEEASRGEAARISNVAMRANIAYDRLEPYLDDLRGAGLIGSERFPLLTSKGREFLRQYRAWSTLLGDFGLR